MKKVCKRHSDNPVMIYHQCAGCELEWFHQKLEQKQQEIKRLEQERDKLIEGLRWYADAKNYRREFRSRHGTLVEPAEAIYYDCGQSAREILEEIGVTVE
jgi:hypothetical protein